jgi:hypothetical protein
MPQSSGRSKWTAAVQKECNFCHQTFNAKGLGSHQRACRIAFEAAEQDVDQHGSQQTTSMNNVEKSPITVFI